MNTNNEMLIRNKHYPSANLISEMNDCLMKLELEDDFSSDQFSFDKLNQSLRGDMKSNINHSGSSSSLSQICLQSTPQLFKQQLRNSDATQSSPQINLDLFREKIKEALGQSSPTEKRKQSIDDDDDDDNNNNNEGRTAATGENKLPSQFSTNYKQKNPYKSRQISIHTNAFLATDAGDDLSNKQEMFSTARTTQFGSIKAHQRNTSNTKSFFTQTQTDNTFISYDNNQLNEQLQNQQEFNDPSDDKFLEKYQQGLKQYMEGLNNQTMKQKRRLVTHDQELKLRPNLKRKIKSVVNDPATVPMEIFYRIISYDSNLFRKFLCLSHGMKKHLLFHTFDTSKKITQDFQKKYGQVFEVERKFLSLTPISFCKEEGTRLEFVMRIKVKKEAKKLENRSVIIGHGFNYEITKQDQNESKIDGEYQSLYQFDLFKCKTNRWLWLHKDESLVNYSFQKFQFHGLTDARAYTIPIFPICTEDSFEISITLLSLMGALDRQSVKWQHLKIEPLPNQNDIRDYNRFKNLTPQRDLLAKYFADLKRVCEVEDTVCEWYNEPYVKVDSLRQHIKRKLDTSNFNDQFEILNVEVGGLDFSVWKLLLQAKKNPSLDYKFYEDLNMGIRIQTQQKPICNEVKRTGFLIDRGEDIEVRPGDTVLVYVSMGGFEK